MSLWSRLLPHCYCMGGSDEHLTKTNLETILNLFLQVHSLNDRLFVFAANEIITVVMIPLLHLVVAIR